MVKKCKAFEKFVEEIDKPFDLRSYGNAWHSLDSSSLIELAIESSRKDNRSTRNVPRDLAARGQWATMTIGHRLILHIMEWIF